MVVWVVETIYKVKYFIFLSIKKHRENAKSTGKRQGKHREFCLDGSVATLLNLITLISASHHYSCQIFIFLVACEVVVSIIAELLTQ